jgi:hypothetical protein
VPPAAASADTAVAELIGVAPSAGFPSLPVPAASPVPSTPDPSSGPHPSLSHPLLRLLRRVLECKSEPVVELSDEEVVAERVCPAGWNGRAGSLVDMWGSERQE